MLAHAQPLGLEHPAATTSLSKAHHPLPEDRGFCVVIPNFLNPEECRHFIALSEGRSFSSADMAYPPSYRNNDRFVLDDQELAAGLLARLRLQAPEQIRDSEAMVGQDWALEAINEKFRFCRYGAGQEFHIHQDGAHHRGADRVSRVTFLVYLSGEEAFSGGDTVFYAGGPAQAEAGGLPPELARVRPQAGSLIIFDHALWHAGEAVTKGCKHIMRSDLIYRNRAWRASTQPSNFSNAHDGYVWTLAELADGAVASGGRDTTIRVWHRDGTLKSELRGHRQSVLGLARLDNGRLASVSRDQSLRLWDLSSAEQSIVIEKAHSAAVLCVSALPGQRLATGGADQLVKVWYDDSTALLTLSGHHGWVWAVKPLDAQRLATASEDGDLRIWQTDSGNCVQRLAGKTPLRALATWGGGRVLVTGDNTGQISAWLDAGGQPRLAASFRAHAAAVRCLRFLDAQTLASGGEDYCTRVWHWPGQELRAEFASANFVTDVLPKERELLISSYDGCIQRCNY